MKGEVSTHVIMCLAQKNSSVCAETERERVESFILSAACNFRVEHFKISVSEMEKEKLYLFFFFDGVFLSFSKFELKFLRFNDFPDDSRSKSQRKLNQAHEMRRINPSLSYPNEILSPEVNKRLYLDNGKAR